ncbi:hypothetical protein EEP06_03525 [Salmonella enterica]|uniref:hypothetical protein n=1 Tax=Leminorella grimontii TaxID=82981 RepID=UPI000FADD776|nr:hypothetical protein [Salmonella enterica]
MVIRGYGKCNTCNTGYMLRAGVGVEKYQLHHFDCRSCELPIVIAVRAKPPEAHFEAEDNISLCGIIEDDYIVINLHPNFAFTLKSLHDEKAFPSIEYNERIIPHLRLIPNSKLQDTATQFDIPNTKELWGLVKNILTLESKKEQRKILQKTIKNYEKQRNKYVNNTIILTPHDALFNFLDSLFYPRINQLLEPALKLVTDIKKSFPDEFSRFVVFFKNDIKNEQYIRYVSIFSDFFKIHSQLGQLMVHARINESDVDDKIVGSKSFDDVKLYYGQAYETITSSFVTLAALNNIKNSRKFDEFKSMSLNKYIKDVEKAKRAKPFENTPEFFVFSDDLDSSLRNGSHHAAIWKDGEKVFYRSGGAGQERNITYANYLHMCNKLTISLAALWLLDRYIENE